MSQQPEQTYSNANFVTRVPPPNRVSTDGDDCDDSASVYSSSNATLYQENDDQDVERISFVSKSVTNSILPYRGGGGIGAFGHYPLQASTSRYHPYPSYQPPPQYRGIQLPVNDQHQQKRGHYHNLDGEGFHVINEEASDDDDGDVIYVEDPLDPAVKQLDFSAVVKPANQQQQPQPQPPQQQSQQTHIDPSVPFPCQVQNQHQQQQQLEAINETEKDKTKNTQDQQHQPPQQNEQKKTLTFIEPPESTTKQDKKVETGKDVKTKHSSRSNGYLPKTDTVMIHLNKNNLHLSRPLGKNSFMCREPLTANTTANNNTTLVAKRSYRHIAVYFFTHADRLHSNAYFDMILFSALQNPFVLNGTVAYRRSDGCREVHAEYIDGGNLDKLLHGFKLYENTLLKAIDRKFEEHNGAGGVVIGEKEEGAEEDDDDLQKQQDREREKEDTRKYCTLLAINAAKCVARQVLPGLALNLYVFNKSHRAISHRTIFYKKDGSIKLGPFDIFTKAEYDKYNTEAYSPEEEESTKKNNEKKKKQEGEDNDDTNANREGETDVVNDDDPFYREYPRDFFSSPFVAPENRPQHQQHQHQQSSSPQDDNTSKASSPSSKNSKTLQDSWGLGVTLLCLVLRIEFTETLPPSIVTARDITLPTPTASSSALELFHQLVDDSNDDNNNNNNNNDDKKWHAAIPGPENADLRFLIRSLLQRDPTKRISILDALSLTFLFGRTDDEFKREDEENEKAQRDEIQRNTANLELPRDERTNHVRGKDGGKGLLRDVDADYDHCDDIDDEDDSQEELNQGAVAVKNKEEGKTDKQNQPVEEERVEFLNRPKLDFSRREHPFITPTEAFEQQRQSFEKKKEHAVVLSRFIIIAETIQKILTISPYHFFYRQLQHENATMKSMPSLPEMSILLPLPRLMKGAVKTFFTHSDLAIYSPAAESTVQQTAIAGSTLTTSLLSQSKIALQHETLASTAMTNIHSLVADPLTLSHHVSQPYDVLCELSKLFALELRLRAIVRYEEAAKKQQEQLEEMTKAANVADASAAAQQQQAKKSLSLDLISLTKINVSTVTDDLMCTVWKSRCGPARRAMKAIYSELRTVVTESRKLQTKEDEQRKQQEE